MIVPLEITRKYNEILPSLERLKKDLDPVLEKIATKMNGLFFSRIKLLESFAQKLEGGIFEADKIIDLYGATIVVATTRELEKVENEVKSSFQIHKKIVNREKAPEQFIYDDLHLFISFQPKVEVPNKEFLKRKFELQVKTFLQYSWDKATHDLLYKGKNMSWPLFRVAYQTKAMLEQADQVLAQIDKTAEMCPENEYKVFREKNKIISLAEKTWKREQLSVDMRRLSTNIYDLLDAAGKNVRFLKQELSSPANKDLIQAKSITPHQAVLGILIRKDPKKLIKGLKRMNRKALLTRELLDFMGKIPQELIDLSVELGDAVGFKK